MGIKTGISWTDHTFNPWWGCVKVSPACTHCYAETWARRMGHEVWGPTAPRRFFGDQHWNEPLVWNRKAAAEGVTRKVFSASMADVFEDYPGLDEQRTRLYSMIEQTPNLMWLLLTKRPENIEQMVPREWLDSPRRNVALGVTAEDEKYARERLSILRQIPNTLAWVSYEPAIELIDWAPYLDFVKWIIFGGESGADPRPAESDWAIQTMQQCADAGSAFFFKQAGSVLAKQWGCKQKEGKEPSEWPSQLQVQQFPEQIAA